MGRFDVDVDLGKHSSRQYCKSTSSYVAVSCVKFTHPHVRFTILGVRGLLQRELTPSERHCAPVALGLLQDDNVAFCE